MATVAALTSSFGSLQLTRSSARNVNVTTSQITSNNSAQEYLQGSPLSSQSVKYPLASLGYEQKYDTREVLGSERDAILDPQMKFANLMWFRGAYNAQIFVSEDEPADSVVRRFRKAVMQAGVIPECRRRKFFETPQDIVKRKQQNAQRRKSRRFSPRTEGFGGEKKEGGAGGSSAGQEDDDFWGFAEE